MSGRLADEVHANGRTFYAPMLACRPVRPFDYPPARLRAWNAASAAVGRELPIYSGSVEDACERCSIAVLVAPRQEEARQLATSIGLRSHVVCSLCAVEDMAETGRAAVSLGNPEGDL